MFQGCGTGCKHAGTVHNDEVGDHPGIHLVMAF